MKLLRDFPWSAINTRPSNAGGTGLISGQGTKIPACLAVWPKKEEQMIMYEVCSFVTCLVNMNSAQENCPEMPIQQSLGV